MKSSCLNARALILSLQPCSGQNDSGMTNLSFRAGNEWAGVLLFPYREAGQLYLGQLSQILDNFVYFLNNSWIFSPEVAEFIRFNITILVLITIHIKFYWFCLWCEAGGGDGRWAGEVEGGGEVCYEVPLFAPWNDLLSVGLLTPPSVCLNIISIAWIIETTQVVNRTWYRLS